MTTNGSFYQNSQPISTLETNLGAPTVPVANPQNSSFYVAPAVVYTKLPPPVTF